MITLEEIKRILIAENSDYENYGPKEELTIWLGRDCFDLALHMEYDYYSLNDSVNIEKVWLCNDKCSIKIHLPFFKDELTQLKFSNKIYEKIKEDYFEKY